MSAFGLQGCNLALESVRAFISSLDQVSGDLDKAPAFFTAARIEDVHAMQTIEYMQVGLPSYCICSECITNQVLSFVGAMCHLDALMLQRSLNL